MQPEQIAHEKAESGMRRSLEHAEAESPGWSELAFKFVRLFWSQRGDKQCVGRDIVLAAKEYGLIQPPTDKAWGAVLKRAAKAGVMVRVGTAKDTNRHGNLVPLWAAAKDGGQPR
jgi:hypothetical protein